MLGVPDACGRRYGLRCTSASVTLVLFLDLSDSSIYGVVSAVEEESEELDESLVLVETGGETGAGRGGSPCCVRTRMYASVA